MVQTNHLRNIWTGPASGDPKPIIYLGGDAFKYGDKSPEVLDILRFCCLSYFDLGKGKSGGTLDILRRHGIRSFLDSGAFSYQMLGLKRKQPLEKAEAEVIIDRYADWVHASTFVFDFLVTFDYLRDPDVVLWTTERLEARGLHPVPVYHIGSSLKALRRLIDRGYTLIGIGGLAGSTDTAHPPTPGSKARPFLDQVFNLTEKHGVRLHGFGIGGQIIGDYPWFSVDSTSWLHYTRRGMVNQPSNNPRKLFKAVPVSSRIAAIHDSAFDNQTQQWAVHNIKFWSQIGCPPPPRKKGLF